MKEIKLTKGRVALIDDEDFELINQYKWYAHRHSSGFYASRNERIKGKQVKIKMCRFIMKAKLGEIIDHKDRNPLNNQKSNLRIATHAQNMGNRGASKSSTSKFIGVSFDKQTNKFRAKITVSGTRIYIGRFVNEEDAARAYDIKAIELRGEFTALNFK